MKVLVVSNLYPPEAVGGAEHVAETYARSLTDLGVDVHVLCTAANRVGLRPHWITGQQDGTTVHRMRSAQVYHFTKRPRLTIARVPWFLLDLWNPLHDRRYTTLLDLLRPDVVITNNLWNIGTSIWNVTPPSIPAVHLLHDGSSICATGLMRHGTRECRGDVGPCRVLTRYRREQSRTVRAVVAPSAFLMEEVCDRASMFARATRFVIPNPYEQQTISARHSSGDLRLGYLGQLEAHKGPLTAATAVAGLNGVSLDVAGEGSQQEQIRQYATGNIRVLGRVTGPAKRAFYQSLDALLVPSVCHENSPGVVFEAFSAGVPVIASSVGGIPESVIPGFNGVLVPPDNPVALRAAVIRLRDNPELLRNLATGARTSALARSSATSPANQLLQVLESVAHTASH